jgi:hypothetical protein
MTIPDGPRPVQAPARAEPLMMAGLTVQPGQTLVLAVKDTTTPERLEALAQGIKERLPDVHVLVLGGVEQMAVYDPGAPAENRETP